MTFLSMRISITLLLLLNFLKMYSPEDTLQVLNVPESSLIILNKDKTAKISENHKRLKMKINRRSTDRISRSESLKDIKHLLDNVLQKVQSLPPSQRRNVNEIDISDSPSRAKSNSQWGSWTDWSHCSVSCGKGRRIRWRQCVIKDCDAETEMEEKSCQMPECSPFDIFR